MKKLLALIAFSVLLLVPAGTQNAFAAPVPIPITNHSFEDPPFESLTVTGWTETETSASDASTKFSGFINGILAAQLENGAKISQSLGIIAPNTKYTVMLFAFGGATASIFADGTLIDSGDAQIFDPPVTGLTLVLNNINTHTGKELTIVLESRDNFRATFDLVTATSENLDSDGDGVLDGDDICPGFDDNMDTDGDGTADGCDENPTLKCGENTKQEGFECVADLDSICGAGTKIENMMCVISIAVGGAFIGVDKSALFLAAGQLTAAWVLPVIVSGIGFAIVIARKF